MTMTMKSMELSDEMAVSPDRAEKASPSVELSLRQVASRWLDSLRGAMTRYVAHNDEAWDRLVEEQARDPNRY
jgi:hypothetical protein